MLVSIFGRFVFPSFSIFLKVMSFLSLTSSAISGLSEMRGKHLQYSKFWNVSSSSSSSTHQNSSPATKMDQVKLSSRAGMLIVYTPAFLVAVSSTMFYFYSSKHIRPLMLNLALTLHFFKRIFEVLFVHKYSGGMVINAAFVISLGYFSSTALMIYAQNLAQEFPEPPIDLKYIGNLLFLTGISGNFYHHYLLSRLRKDEKDKEYKIPKGGMFNLVICPNYLFEIIGFIGVSFISQTLFSFSVSTGMMFYLIGRSFATKRWYLSKFDDFPQDLKALVPYLF